jgi:hypothetical protein
MGVSGEIEKSERQASRPPQMCSAGLGESCDMPGRPSQYPFTCTWMGGYVRIIFWQKEKNGGDNFLEISGPGVFFIHRGKI